MKIYPPALFTKSLLLFLCIIPLLTRSQDKTMDCSALRTGFFHCYPKNSTDHFFYTRDNEYQKEIDTKKGDTSVWKIGWLDDCSYTLKYVSGKMDKTMQEFLKNHFVVCRINTVTDNYFTFSGFIDKISDHAVLSDTMWSSERPNRSAEEPFAAVRMDWFGIKF